MAGTLYGLGLSQRVDPNGQPDGGWRLYTYVAASDTPATAYKDTGLTIAHPWPILADAYGMMPSFWLADGSYRARATSSDGSRVFFDLSSELAIGPSSGGGGGGSVDATTIFQTGDTMWQDVQGTRAGWVRDNGRTIGSSTSGATERANSDCQSLFEWLWNNFDNTKAAVVSGRGASAAADWTANKQITMPDKRGYAPGGLDDMGNSAAGRYANVPVISGSVTQAGSLIGENTHTLLEAELPSIAPVVTGLATSFNSNEGNILRNNSGGQIHVTDAGSGTAIYPADARNVTSTDIAPPTSGNEWTVPFGSGQAQPIVQRTVLGTFFRKL